MICLSDDVTTLEITMGPSGSLQTDCVWLFLSRHVDGAEQDEYMALQANESAPKSVHGQRVGHATVSQ